MKTNPIPNPILLSNQYIFEAVQPETSDEPVGKSTILYANRFAGVQETDIQDEALLDILNSTIGTSGNNVLVQLKQKMKAYPGGPWYIDSNDGVVHIHNRKFTEKTSHVYTYMGEPGEVLSASFRIVEVYKQDTAGLAAYVNAVNKTVSALLNPFVENPPERPYTEIDPNNPSAFKIPKSQINRDPQLVEFEQQRQAKMDRFRRERAEDAARQKEWNSKTPQQRQAVRNQFSDQAFDKAVGAGLEERVRQAPEFKWLIYLWDYYQYMCKSYGSKSYQAQKAYKEYMDAGPDRTYIGGINTQAYWDWHKVTLTVTNTYYLGANISPKASSRTIEQSRSKAINKAINTWLRNHRGMWSGSVNIIKTGNWTTVNKDVSLMSSTRSTTEKCKITIQIWSRLSVPYKYPLSRLLGEYTGSGGTRTGDPLAAMRNAAANIGRARKEKQLQASIRVVGNPKLESTQQFIIQNVGKKYSGVWYIKSVSHTFEHGQGYICDLTLSKQQGKSKVSGESSTINTRNYTSGSGKGSTSKGGRPLAKPVSDNYSYQDAMNQSWSAGEYLFVRNAVLSQQNEHDARESLIVHSYNIADKNMYNHQNNSNSSYVTNRNGKITAWYRPEYLKVNRKKVNLPKEALKILREFKNRK